MIPGDLGPVLQVRTWSDGPEPHFQRAHLTINVPGAENVRVQTTRGRVYAIDIQGAVDISTTGGDVRVMTNWAMRDAVTITNEDGDIDYRVRGDSTGDFVAETADGQVRSRVRRGVFDITEQRGHRMIATLNGGGNPIHLKTVEGDVRVAVVHNPTEVGIYIIDP